MLRPVPLVAAGLLIAYGLVRRRRLGRVELGLGALVVAALAVYGAGAFQLPNLEHLVRQVGETLGPYTYALVAVMAFLETGAFVGLLAPGETVILVGGVIAGQGRISIVALIAIVWACAVAGDVTSFLLGRRLGREFLLRHGPKVKITHERFEQVERFFAKHGGKAILLGRFVGLVRAVAPFIAGSSGMRLRRFLPYDVVGAGLWGSAYCLLGYVFWQSFDRVSALASKGALALATVIVVVVGGIAAFRWLRRPEHREQARVWLREQGERPLVRPLARHVVAPAARALAGPGRLVAQRLPPGERALELTTLAAVVAVGWFAFGALLDALPSTGPSAVDRAAFSVAAGVRSSALVDLAREVTRLGALPVVAGATLLAAAALVRRRHALEALVLVVGLALTVLVVHVTKGAVDRSRPDHPLVGTREASFPSGHAAYSAAWVAIAVALARGVGGLAGRAAVVVGALVLAGAIGLTRVELRAHFLTDVLAGWAVGAGVLALCGLGGLLVDHVRHNGRTR